MEIQLEFNFFDYDKYSKTRAQMILNNVPQVIGIEEPQEKYQEFLKRMLKEEKQNVV